MESLYGNKVVTLMLSNIYSIALVLVIIMVLSMFIFFYKKFKNGESNKSLMKFALFEFIATTLILYLYENKEKNIIGGNTYSSLF